MRNPVTIKPYSGPAGGWGSARSLARVLVDQGIPASGALTMLRQNKRTGFACVSCAWPKPHPEHPFEFCENGAKATAWEITTRRVGPDFFARHTCAELRGWSDYALEAEGRLTHPMRWDASTDRYVPVSWQSAFAEIGHELKQLAPKEVVFYASGRASLETTYMYTLLARMYGTNNLPDSSNMCHESTSVALPESIGVPVGTVTLEDFKHADLLMFFGHNPGTSSPRMLNDLQACARRGVPIVTFNPLRERGLERFKSPQHVGEMLSPDSTQLSTQYHQVKAGGDVAALFGMCKALIAWDDEAQAMGRRRVLDAGFIAEHTHGFQGFAAVCRAYDWGQLERSSGLKRADLEAAAAAYAQANRVMAMYGMGLTQHRTGVENCQMLCNLLLLRGNIGKTGAGILPVRGHSNVQGQRTVGMTEKPDLVPNDKLREQFGFEPPMDVGMNTVEACEGIVAGRVRAFVQLGGNFVRAIPDTAVMEQAWVKQRLTVQIVTKLNRGCLVHGAVSYILPCIGRIEVDTQASGPQSVSIEDSTACIHGSKGVRTPASEHLLSEPAIVAGIAKATLAPNPKLDWDAWVADYSRVRAAIGVTYPDFHDMEARMWEPGGFHRTLPAATRVWKTSTGKANFIAPRSLDEDPDARDGGEVMRLMTLRSNDQFNTTIYGYDDRFRGVKGTRMVLFINRRDLARRNLREGQTVALETVSNDRVTRRVAGFRVTTYDIPDGCLGAYYPECNPLIPLWHHAERSKVPAAKSVPVRIVA